MKSRQVHLKTASWVFPLTVRRSACTPMESQAMKRSRATNWLASCQVNVQWERSFPRSHQENRQIRLARRLQQPVEERSDQTITQTRLQAQYLPATHKPTNIPWLDSAGMATSLTKGLRGLLEVPRMLRAVVRRARAEPEYDSTESSPWEGAKSHRETQA